jgi:hypothetical protein
MPSPKSKRRDGKMTDEKNELTTEYTIQSAHRQDEGESRSLALDAALVVGGAAGIGFGQKFGSKAGSDVYDATLGKVVDKLAPKDDAPKNDAPTGGDE